MASRLRSTLLTWTTLVPVLAALLLVLTWGRSIGYAVVVLVALALGAAVLAGVHHAEVVAHGSVSRSALWSWPSRSQ